MLASRRTSYRAALMASTCLLVWGTGVPAALAAPPTAVDDSVTTAVSKPVSVNVLANDFDPDGDPLSITGSTQPAHGTVVCPSPQIPSNCNYSPTAGYEGHDSFTYTVGNSGGSDVATVRITVGSPPPNSAPVANDDETSTPEDTAKVGITVLTNDTDADVDQLSITGSTQGAHGSVSCGATACTYTPAPNFNGSDGFSYTISDGFGGTDTATVSVTVTQVNDAPGAVDDTLSTPTNTPGNQDVVVNDTDIDGDSLAVTGKTDGAHGSVTCGTSICTYTPDQDYVGADSFTYTVGDGHGGADTATVGVTVTGVVQTFDVSVTKTPKASSVAVGNLTGYTIAVHNAGPSSSAPVSLTDPLPAGFKYQKDSSALCSVTSGTLSCSLGALASGATVVVTVDGAFVSAGSIHNTVTISSTGDSEPVNNSDTATTTVTGKTCTVVGTFGDDVVNGSDKADVLCGLSGNDKITGKGGADTIYGNEGNDRLNGSSGNDLLDGGLGSDTAVYSALAQAVTVNLGQHKATGQGTDQLTSVENVEGSGNADALIGDAKGNVLSGLGGNDQLIGGGGKDKLVGGAGNDLLDGGAGSDSCSQGPGTGALISC